MLGDLWPETIQLVIAGGIVAAITLPFGLLAWLAFRKSGKPLLPHWRPWGGPWSFFEVIVVILVIEQLVPMTIQNLLEQSEITSGTPVQAFPQSEPSGAVAGMPATLAAQKQQADTAKKKRYLLANVLALPLQLTLLLGACRMLYPDWWFLERPKLSAQILLAIIGWAAITFLVHGLNVLLTILFAVLEWQRDIHPLVKLAGRPFIESALVCLQACVAAPIIEEIVFRGVILSWAIASRNKRATPDIPSNLRPWVIASLGLMYTIALFAVGYQRIGAIIFSFSLVVGVAVVGIIFRRKKRTACAIYSSAAFFAAVHSSVWPSPIPLFVLGLGLGWLAVRTRSVLVPIIVHALFNAVSAVVLLSSAG